MKKENFHDYVSEAYRYYALCGRPDGEALRRMRLGAADERHRAEILDLESVSRVMERLRSDPDGRYLTRCLEIIYFTQPQLLPSRGMMTDRVCAAADELNLSESAVYRIMKRLRLMLAVERGLRTEDTGITINAVLCSK